MKGEDFLFQTKKFIFYCVITRYYLEIFMSFTFRKNISSINVEGPFGGATPGKQWGQLKITDGTCFRDAKSLKWGNSFEKGHAESFLCSGLLTKLIVICNFLKLIIKPSHLFQDFHTLWDFLEIMYYFPCWETESQRTKENR